MLINVRVGLGLARGAGGEVAGPVGVESPDRGGYLSTVIFATQCENGAVGLDGRGSVVSSLTVTGPHCP